MPIVGAGGIGRHQPVCDIVPDMLPVALPGIAESAAAGRVKDQAISRLDGLGALASQPLPRCQANDAGIARRAGGGWRLISVTARTQ